MQDDNAVRPASWLEKGAPALTGIAALAAAAFYFVGWQYKQSLALTFGFASYPGDLSFQGTVATGVAVFDSMILPLVALALALIYGALSFLSGLPRALKRLVRGMKLKRTKIRRRLIKVRKDVLAAKDDHPALLKLEVVLRKLDKDLRRLDLQLLGVEWIIGAARFSSHFVAFVIAFVFATTLLVLVYAGHLVAQMDAKAIRLQAGGKCEGCFMYVAKPASVIGVPLFQSADTIYVHRTRGITRVRVDQLYAIRPYGKPRANPIRLPRR